MLMSILSMLLKNYVEIVFFDNLLTPKRFRYSYKFYLYFFSITLSFELIIHFIQLGTPILFIVSLFTILSFLMFYKGAFVQKVLYGIILVLLVIVTEIISGLILLTLHIPIILFETNALYRFVQISINTLLLFLCILSIKVVKNRDTLITKKIWLTIYPITSIIIIYAFYLTLIKTLSQTTYYTIFLIISCLILISNIAIIYIINSIIKSELNRQYLEFIKNYFVVNKNHQSDLISLQKNIKKMRHDLKSSLLHIYGLLKSEKYDQCIILLDNMLESAKNFEKTIITGYDGLDAVITSKIFLAHNKGIELLPIITLPKKKDLWIDEFDLSLICANILDNAIEATVLCSIRDSTINFQIGYNWELSIIRIFCNNPTINKTLPVESTKKNKSYHGFGLKNISDLAKKWNGMTQFEINNGSFTIIVSLHNCKDT